MNMVLNVTERQERTSIIIPTFMAEALQTRLVDQNVQNVRKAPPFATEPLAKTPAFATEAAIPPKRKKKTRVEDENFFIYSIS